MNLEDLATAGGDLFFYMEVPRVALAKALNRYSSKRLIALSGEGAFMNPEVLVLGLRRARIPECHQYIKETGIPMLPFPEGMCALVDLALDTTVYGPANGDTVSVRLARYTFDHLTEQHRAPRVERFPLKPGVAIDDPITERLGRCLLDATLGVPLHSVFQDSVGAALHLHFALRYGGMRIQNSAGKGGLAPWQLRLSRAEIEMNLGSKMFIETLAKKCGLSASHFARAFTISTELSPHRFIMQRRVEKAQDLLKSTDCALVEIGLQCGFADQSHFNRVFSSIARTSPGKWRATHRRAKQLA
jgi:AraC family transcriptional regulator